MARAARDSGLDRTNRHKIGKGKERRLSLESGLTLIYRRPIGDGLGSWTAKIRKPDGAHYAERGLGMADDSGTANGETVLTFAQAQVSARREAQQYRRSVGLEGAPLTVRAACAYYMSVFTGKDPDTQRRAIDAHIIPSLGDRLASDLKAAEIKAWHVALAQKPARLRTGRFAAGQNHRPVAATPDEIRARRSTANRLLTVLRAVLSRCFKDSLLEDDREWRRVERFDGADQARDRFPTEAELIRLQNAAKPDLRALIRGALFTGCRLGELSGLRAQDVDADKGQVYVTAGQAKSNRARYVELSADGVTFFRTLTAGMKRDAFVFTRATGAPWKRHLHRRELVLANKAARVSPPLTFHHLRHAYASHLLLAGARIEYVSELLGHSSIAITKKHYAHYARASLKDAASKLPSFGYVEDEKMAVVKPLKAKRTNT